MDFATSVLVTGAGATAATDLWAIARKRLLGIPPPDYGLVGRWLGHMAWGRFRHERIAATPPLRGGRVQSLATHTVFGLGLYATAWIASSLQVF